MIACPKSLAFKNIFYQTTFSLKITLKLKKKRITKQL
jgi:hypothetical protein